MLSGYHVDICISNAKDKILVKIEYFVGKYSFAKFDSHT